MSNWFGISDYQRQQRWVPVKYDESESVPPFGVVVSRSMDVSSGDPLIVVDQPAGGSLEALFLNGPAEIRPGESGAATRDFPAIARYKTTGGAPQIGEEWGPKAGQWELDSNGMGFTIVAAGSTPDANGFGLVLVIAEPGSAPCDFIRFQITDSDCRNATAVGKVLARPCGCSEVPGEFNGHVNLVDNAGCYLDEGDGSLKDRVGFAKYMQSEETSASIGSLSLPLAGSASLDVEDCNWEIIALCCDTVIECE